MNDYLSWKFGMSGYRILSEQQILRFDRLAAPGYTTRVHCCQPLEGILAGKRKWWRFWKRETEYVEQTSSPDTDGYQVYRSTQKEWYREQKRRTDRVAERPEARRKRENPYTRTVDTIPIKTHLITEHDDIVEVCKRYVPPAGPRPGDVLVISEKIVAVIQGRTRRFADIREGFWARFLSARVSKAPWGIGAVGLPVKMQAAIDLVGLPRILLAGVVGAITRALGHRGDFYRIAGPEVAQIDGSRVGTFERYINVIIYGPAFPKWVCERVSSALGGIPTAVIDANDYGDVDVLGKTDDVDGYRLALSIADNPLGQELQKTPLGLVRPRRP